MQVETCPSLFKRVLLSVYRDRKNLFFFFKNIFTIVNEKQKSIILIVHVSKFFFSLYARVFRYSLLKRDKELSREVPLVVK